MRLLPVAFLTSAVLAQPPAAQTAPHATFSTGTHVVLVPVIVRDSDGKALGNLSKADFELLDDGKNQAITRFSIERLSEKAQKQGAQLQALESVSHAGTALNTTLGAIPNRFIAYWFDDIHLDTGSLVGAREAARRFFSNEMNPGDRAAILTSSGSVTVEFTSDRAALREALPRINQQLRAMTDTMDCPPMTYYEADRILQGDTIATQVASIEAQRCRGSNRSFTQGTTTRALQSAVAIAAARGDRNATAALQSLGDAMNRMKPAPGQRLLILISPGFYVADRYRAREGQLLDQAIRASIVVSSLDARGLYQVNPNIGASQAGNLGATASEIVANFRRVDALTTGDVLADFSYGTSGILFQNNNDLFEGLQQATALPEYQYVLEFSPRGLKYDGAFHKLQVNVRAKGYDPQARRGYYAPNHAPNAAEDSKERVRDAMFSRDEMLDIPMEVQTEFFKSPDGKANLFVLAKIDLKALHYRTEEGQLVDNLTIDTGVFDRNGQMVEGTSKTFALKFKRETFEQRVARATSEKASFSVASGNYVVRVVIHDSEGDMIAARNGVVEIP